MNCIKNRPRGRRSLFVSPERAILNQPTMNLLSYWSIAGTVRSHSPTRCYSWVRRQKRVPKLRKHGMIPVRRPGRRSQREAIITGSMDNMTIISRWKGVNHSGKLYIDRPDLKGVWIYAIGGGYKRFIANSWYNDIKINEL